MRFTVPFQFTFVTTAACPADAPVGIIAIEPTTGVEELIKGFFDPSKLSQIGPF